MSANLTSEQRAGRYLKYVGGARGYESDGPRADLTDDSLWITFLVRRGVGDKVRTLFGRPPKIVRDLGRVMLAVGEPDRVALSRSGLLSNRRSSYKIGNVATVGQSVTNRLGVAMEFKMRNPEGFALGIAALGMLARDDKFARRHPEVAFPGSIMRSVAVQPPHEDIGGPVFDGYGRLEPDQKLEPGVEQYMQKWSRAVTTGDLRTAVDLFHAGVTAFSQVPMQHPAVKN